MPETLMSILDDSVRRAVVVSDTVDLIEAEVKSKSGLRGAAIRTGFNSVKKLKPGIIRSAVDKLLPHFAPAVDPHYAKAAETGNPRAYFTTNADSIADALLAVTDAKASNADNAVMKRVYKGLRGSARQHTAAAMPALADLIHRHVA